MNKISVIIKREYLSRVKKKSFIVMTILGPILLAALFVVPAVLAKVSESQYHVAIVDETTVFKDYLKDHGNVKFTVFDGNFDVAYEMTNKGDFDALLFIPEFAIKSPAAIRLFSTKSININARTYIESSIKHEIEYLKLAQKEIDPEILKQVETPISITSIRIDKDGHESVDFTEMRMVLGFVTGFLIYIFIFMFGSLVLRSVLEEKTNRIVEIIVSSVKPFQLMMGKILGVGMVGLTQFVIWIVFTAIIVFGIGIGFPEVFQHTEPNQVYVTSTQGLNPTEVQNQIEMVTADNTMWGEVMQGIRSINFPFVIFSFLFYFLGGYLLYSALFAAIGSAVDSETDSQQFMFPVTIPLLLSIVMMQPVIQDPSGPIAFWLSVIPLTSPVIMMIRIPFGVPVFDLVLSASLLVVGFVFATWLAAKIYRTGILMYGKKITYGELWKWMRS
jgi:ABC-2 type transport system permease protein